MTTLTRQIRDTIETDTHFTLTLAWVTFQVFVFWHAYQLLWRALSEVVRRILT